MSLLLMRVTHCSAGAEVLGSGKHSLKTIWGGSCWKLETGARTLVLCPSCMRAFLPNHIQRKMGLPTQGAELLFFFLRKLLIL